MYKIILESACVLWDPYTASDSLTIERVQRLFIYFTGRVLKINHPAHDYTPVVHEPCLDTLADRRANINLKFLHRIIDGTYDAPTQACNRR